MIVIGYLYNSNGMATWCIESAYALFEAGKSVLLVCAESRREEIEKASYPFPLYFVSDPGEKQTSSRWKRAFDFYSSTFSNQSSGWVKRVHSLLLEQGYKPSVYLLNQSNLQDSSVKVAQYVVAWAYPATWQGYLAKCKRQSPQLFSKSFLFSILNALSWYRKDSRAYREATGVLAVSQRLTESLRRKGIKAHLLHPSIRQVECQLTENPSTVKKVLLAAVDLENNQKRIPWVLEAFAKAKEKETLEFHLVGSFSNLPKHTEAWGLKTVFTGRLKREELLAYMEQMDLFIFGSSFDDWGYVQVEALSKGLKVLAPNISPSDEILANGDMLYEVEDSVELVKKTFNLVNQKGVLTTSRLALFGTANFVKNLEAILNSK